MNSSQNCFDVWIWVKSLTILSKSLKHLKNNSSQKDGQRYNVEIGLASPWGVETNSAVFGSHQKQNKLDNLT